MNKRTKTLKKFLRKYKEDLLYLLFAGIPSGIVSLLNGPSMDYSHLY